MFRTVFLLSICGWSSIRGIPVQADGIVQSGNGTNLGRSPRKGFTCETNEWDREQWCLCKPGEKVSSISSVHDNYREDRRWTLTCSKIEPEFNVPNRNPWYKTTAETEYDAPIWWSGVHEDAFLVGMTSVHSNPHEDRQFKFFTSRSDRWYLTNCIWHHNVNDYDEKLEYTLGDDDVIAGFYSLHINAYEDRRWSIKVCKLRKKCTEIIKIEYDEELAFVSGNEVGAGHSVFNNRNGLSEKEFSHTISQSDTKSLTESYEFSQTSGWTNEVSLSVTGGVSVGVPGVNQYNLEMTFGASHSWNLEKTWTRSNSKEYTKDTTRQLTYKSTCKAGCFCKLFVSVETAKGVVPYKMWSQSVDGEKQCVEEGKLTVEYAFNGRAEAEDVC